MDTLTLRQYAGADDLSAMQALLRAAPCPFDIYPSPSDLPAMLDPEVSETPDHTAVWEDRRGNVVGFAIVTQHHNLHARFVPRERIMEVGPQLCAWAVDQLRLATGEPEEITLDAAARDDDELMTRFLLEHGFLTGESSTIHMSRGLRDPLPAVELPPGFSLRPLRGESEVPAYVSMHRSAYGTAMMTEEGRKAMMRQPHYAQDLDLVAVRSNGELAAFCVCSIDVLENERVARNEGEIAIVGVHPDHRGLALGRAVVLAGMHALQRKGVTRAVLTVASDNGPAVRIYEKVGFRADWSIRWYAKPPDD